MSSKQQPDFDVIAIGAGFAGLALIHHIREAGLSIRVFDKADDVGGTWTWNRYPGAMTDSESYYYCLTFSKELLQEWSWTRRYPDWKETHDYFRFVADRCNMWPDIQLNTEIVSAEYQKDSAQWKVTTKGGEPYTCKYFISAMGMISEPEIPRIKGMDTFKGPLFHSARWPEGLDYKGKRVGIIGAGATTVQMLPVMSQDAESVTVFHRTEQRHEDTCARSTNRVTHRTCAAMNVHNIMRETKLFHRDHRNDRKGFVDFPEIDIVFGPASLLERLLHRRHRGGREVFRLMRVARG